MDNYNSFMVTRVNEFTAIKTGNINKKKSVSGSGGDFFGLLGASEAENSPVVSAPADLSALSNIDALISLNEITDEDANRKTVLQQGENTLDSLEKLRLALINGTITENMVAGLNQTLSTMKQQYVNDRKLMGVIQDIELRAAVELAKLEMASR